MRHTATTKGRERKGKEGKGREQTVKGEDSSIDVAYCGDDVLNV